MSKLFKNHDPDSVDDVIKLLEQLPDTMTLGTARLMVENIKKWEEEEEEDKSKGKGRWVPEEGEGYWYLTSDNKMSHRYYNDNTQEDRRRKQAGNIYKHKSQASQELNKNKAIESIRRYVSKMWGYDPCSNWMEEKEECENSRQGWNAYGHIYYIAYSHTWPQDGWEARHTCSSQFINPTGFYKKSKHVRDVIKNCKEELETIFNVKQDD